MFQPTPMPHHGASPVPHDYATATPTVCGPRLAESPAPVTADKQSAPAPQRYARHMLLKAAAVGATTAALGGAGPLHALAMRMDSAPHAAFLTEVFDILATGEALFATFYRLGLANQRHLGLSVRQVSALQAVLAEEQLHANFALAHGGVPATTHFSFPHGAATFTDRTAFVATLILIEEMTSAALLALIRDFAERGQPRLAQVAGQLLSVEGGHRVVGRAIQGADPLDNWAFAPVLLDHFAQVPAAVAQAGFLNARPGNDFMYRPARVDGHAVINIRPPTLR